MGTKLPVAVDERIFMDGRHDSNAAAPLSTTLSSLQGRAGGPAFTAETGRVGSWAGFNPACRKAILTHCLYCCCGALHALASLRSVCGPVCLHGKTWLPSSMLQACYMLVHFSHLLRNLVELLVQSIVHSIEKTVHSFQLSIQPFFTKSIYNPKRELARPKFFFLGDRVIALGNCLARLFRSMIGSLDTSVMMRPRQREGLRVSMKMM